MSEAVRPEPDTPGGGEPDRLEAVTLGARRWIRITACDNIPPREGRAVMLGDRAIAVTAFFSGPTSSGSAHR